MTAQAKMKQIFTPMNLALMPTKPIPPELHALQCALFHLILTTTPHQQQSASLRPPVLQALLDADTFATTLPNLGTAPPQLM